MGDYLRIVVNSLGLFDYSCADRVTEKHEIGTFLECDPQSPNLLWVNGASGAGKTFLLESLLSGDKALHIYVSAKKPSEAGEGRRYLARFQKALEEATGSSLESFIKENYTGFIDIAKAAVSAFFKLKDIDIDALLNATAGVGKLFISRKDEKHGIAKVLESFIETESHSKPLLIILDNLTFCDDESFEVIAQLFQRFSKASNIKFIAVTTQEDLSSNSDVAHLLTEEMEHRYVPIPPFKDELPFYQILSEVFTCSGDMRLIAKCLFDYCGGYPEKLKTVIRNLYFSGLLKQPLDGSKCLLKEDDVQDYLAIHIQAHNANDGREPSISIDVNSMNAYEKKILQILTIFGLPVSIEVFTNLSVHIFKKEFHLGKLSKPICDKTLDSLTLGSVIEIENEVKVVHDSIALFLQNYFSGTPSNAMVSSNICSYLKKERTWCVAHGLTEEDIDYLLLKHSKASFADQWEQEAASFALDCFQAGHLKRAVLVASWIAPQTFKILPCSDQIKLVELHYFTGKYDEALKLIDLISLCSLKKQEKYSLFFTKGRCEHLNMKPQEAIASLDAACRFASHKDEKISALNMKMSVLRSIEGKEDEARRIFDELTEGLPGKTFRTPSMCKVLRSSIYYRSNKDSLELIELAIRKVRKTGDILQEAYLVHNSGIPLIYMGEFRAAEDMFKTAEATLREGWIHETSYSLNNIAVAKMLMGNFKLSFELLSQAQFWAQSNYVKLSIQVNRMLCSMHLGLFDASKNISRRLEEALDSENIADCKGVRNILINMGIVAWKTGNVGKAIKLLERAYPISVGTLSEYRCAVLLNRLSHSDYSIPTPFSDNPYYKDVLMEPLLISFGHD